MQTFSAKIMTTLGKLARLVGLPSSLVLSTAGPRTLLAPLSSVKLCSPLAQSQPGCGLDGATLAASAD